MLMILQMFRKLALLRENGKLSNAYVPRTKLRTCMLYQSNERQAQTLRPRESGILHKYLSRIAQANHILVDWHAVRRGA